MALQTQTFSTGDYGWHSWSNAYVIALILTEETVDIATNTSLVSYLFTISNTNNNRFWSNGYSWEIGIAGQTIAIEQFNFDLRNNYTTQTIASGQLTVPHNADGSLDMPYSVSVPNVQNWVSYGPPAMALSGTWALTDIPRQATITGAPNFHDQENPTIAYANPAGSAVDSLQACISLTGEAADIAYRDIPKEGTAYTFVLTEAERNVLRNATATANSRSVFFLVKTGIAGAAYVSSLERTLSIVNGMPTLLPTVEDSNDATIALTGDPAVLVRYYSDAAVTTGAAAQKGATLVSQKVTCGSQSITSGAGIFSGVESGTFTFTATDSRGNTVTQTVTRALVAYGKLTCNLENQKPDAEGNIVVKAGGNYFNGSFGGTENTLTVQYRYKASNGSYGQWQTMTATANGNSYTASAELTGLDYQISYTFQARATDRLSTVLSGEYTARAMPVFDWGEQDFNINGTLKINGTGVSDYIVEQGTRDIWTYRKWKSGIAECWGTVCCAFANGSALNTAATVPFRLENGIATGTLAYEAAEASPASVTAQVGLSGITCNTFVFTKDSFADGTARNVMVHVIGTLAYNLFVSSQATLNQRLSASADTISPNDVALGSYVTGYIPIDFWAERTPYIFRIKGGFVTAEDGKVLFYDSNKTKLGHTYLYTTTANANITMDGTDALANIKKLCNGGSIPPDSADVKFVRMQIYLNNTRTALTEADMENVSISFEEN